MSLPAGITPTGLDNRLCSSQPSWVAPSIARLGLAARGPRVIRIGGRLDLDIAVGAIISVDEDRVLAPLLRKEKRRGSISAWVSKINHIIVIYQENWSLCAS